MSKLLRPVITHLSKRLRSAGKAGSKKSKSNPLLATQTQRNFSGPQEPPDTRSPHDVDPDWWDAIHWEKIVGDIEFEIKNYDPLYALFDISELEYDLKFAKKMYEWRALEKPKYLTGAEAWEQGVVESAFSEVGYKIRGELDYRVIGGRGGVDTKQLFYDDNYLYGPFGTEANPVFVPSRGRFRYTACLGGYDGKPEHEVAWFCLRQGPKHRCPMCGQIFQLWTSDSSHKDHPYHDSSRDYEHELLTIIHA